MRTSLEFWREAGEKEQGETRRRIGIEPSALLLGGFGVDHSRKSYRHCSLMHTCPISFTSPSKTLPSAPHHQMDASCRAKSSICCVQFHSAAAFFSIYHSLNTMSFHPSMKIQLRFSRTHLSHSRYHTSHCHSIQTGMSSTPDKHGLQFNIQLFANSKEWQK